MLGEAGAWRKHRFGIILGAFFCLFLLLSLGLFAFSSPKAPIGTVLPEHSVYEEQVRLFALPDGGFLCVSVHDSQTYLLYLNPDGTPRLREDELELEVLDFPFGQISLTGDTLFLSGQKVDREETIGYLLEFPLSAAGGMMDQVQSFSNDWYEFLTDSFRQTGDGRYYGIRQGDIALFSAEDLQQAIDPGEFPVFQFPALFPEADLQQVEVSPDGYLYLYAHTPDGAAIWGADASVDFSVDQAVQLSGDVPGFPLHPIKEGWVADADGAVYSVEEDRTFSYQTSAWSARGVSSLSNGNLLLQTQENRLEEYVPGEWDTPVASYTFAGPVLAVASHTDTAVLLQTEAGISCLMLSDWEEIPGEGSSHEPETSFEESSGSSVPEVPGISSSGSSMLPSGESSEILSEPAHGDGESGSSSGSSPSEDSSASSSEPSSSDGQPEPSTVIDSSEYPADREAGILRVPSGTTIAQVKKPLHLSKDMILAAVRPQGDTVTSGILKTGDLLQLWKGETLLDEITVVISGDLNGTGTVNTRDEDILVDYLMGEEELDSPYFLAADWDQSGTVDLVDLVLLQWEIYPHSS